MSIVPNHQSPPRQLGTRSAIFNFIMLNNIANTPPEKLSKWLESTAERALYLYSDQRLKAAAEALKLHIGQISSHIEFRYSSKTNSLPALLQDLFALGWQLEAVAPQDIAKILRANIGAKNITLNGATHSKELLQEFLVEKPIARIHLDSFDQIDLVCAIGKEYQISPSIGLRVHDGDSHFGLPHNGNAYGEAKARLQQAGLSISCLHIHKNFPSSMSVEEYRSGYRQNYLRLLQAQDWLSSKGPLPFDLGGGLDSPDVYRIPPSTLGDYHDPNKTNHIRAQAAQWQKDYSLEALAAGMKKSFAEIDPLFLQRPLAFEFGRFLASPSISGLFQVSSKKSQFYPDAQVYLCEGNTALYGSLHRGVHSIGVYDKQSLKIKREPMQTSFIYGNLPHAGDWIAQKILLARASVGDWIRIESMGAYLFPLESGFGFPLPPVLQETDGKRLSR